MFRKPILATVLILTGTLLGVIAGRSVADRTQTRLGRTELDAYAQRLMVSGGRIWGDVNGTHKAIAEANLGFCSPEEIDMMRRLIFASHTVKDIERIQDGKIRCTAVLGPLRNPIALGHPDLATNGRNIYFSTAVASSGGSPGYVSQWPDTAVVMNPAIFEDMTELPMTYAFGYHVVDAKTKQPRIANGFGHAQQLSNDEWLSTQPFERDGSLYLPRCSPRSRFCVVASSPKTYLFGKTSNLRSLLIWTGALTGALFSILPLLFMRSQRTMESQLRRAIRNQTLKLVYQPIIDLDRDLIVGAEVLLRWKDESGESVRPDVFIGVAEDHGFISKITDYVVDHALRELHGLLAPDRFHVSINISAQDLTDSEFGERLASKLRSAGVAPEALALELTERSAADDECAIDAVAQLHAKGHTLYLDDFGTGYSSLAYLHRLQVSAIKIDKSFTRSIGTDAAAASLVPQLLAITSELNLRVVVEGIETAAQLEYFRNVEAGIFAQGFLLGKPMPAVELRQLLASSAKSLSTPVLT